MRQAQNPPAGPAGWDQDEYIGASPQLVVFAAQASERLEPLFPTLSKQRDVAADAQCVAWGDVQMSRWMRMRRRTSRPHSTSGAWALRSEGNAAGVHAKPLPCSLSQLCEIKRCAELSSCLCKC